MSAGNSILSEVFVSRQTHGFIGYFLKLAVEVHGDAKFLHQRHQFRAGAAGRSPQVRHIRRHFNDGHILARALETYGAFDADGAGTDDHRFVADLHLAAVGLRRPVDMRFVDAGKRRNYGF